VARTLRDRTGVRGNFYALTSLQGVESTIAGLDRLIEQMPRALVTAVRSCTEEVAVRARSAAPRRTGALLTAIGTKYFDGGEVGAVFVAPVRASSHAPARHRMFPRWIEFGTRKMDGRPYLLPASEAGFSRLVRMAEDMVRRLVRDAEV
jgi:hypothetical protein